MALSIASTYTHELGTTTVIDSSATFTNTAEVIKSGDTLSLTGLTQYDTLLIVSGSTTFKIIGSELQYSDDSGTTWYTIGSVSGGDGSDALITFTSANLAQASTPIAFEDAIIESLVQSLVLTADTAGTIADDRTLSLEYKSADGTDTFTSGISYSITGSSGDDTIIYSSTLPSAFDASTGSDTLIVEADGGKITLDSSTNAAIGTFENIDASDANGAVTVVMDSGFTSVDLGSAGDVIQIAAASDMGSVTIDGGNGEDTLEITADAQTLADTDLAKLTSVEVLQTADGANSITLGATDSINKIVGGAGADTIDASARTVSDAPSGFYDLEISTGDGDDIVTISQGNDNIDLGDGDNTLNITSSNLTADDSIVAGSGTADTIVMADTDTTIVDSQFTQVSGFEVLTGGTGVTSVTLGDKAKTTGITEVDISTATGAATVDLSSMTTDVNMTVTAGTAGTTIKTKADHITSSDTFTGDATSTADILELTTASDTSSTTTINAAALGGVSNIETLKISATSGDLNVTIDNANDFSLIDATTSTGNNTIDASAELDVTGGITINTGSGDDTITTGNTTTGVTINAGNGDNTITLGSATNDVTTGSGDDIVNIVAGTDTIDLGAGENTVNSLYADFTSADTISGTGINTLVFSDKVLDDGSSDLVETKLGVGKVDVIKLGDDSAQVVTLGSGAKTSGVIKVDATALTTATSSTTVDLTAMGLAGDAMSVQGGAGTDTIKIASADLTAATEFDLGASNTDEFDTIEISDAATIVDTDFILSSGVDKLTFAIDDAHSITLGDKAMNAGVRVIDTSVKASDGTTAQATASTIDLSGVTVDQAMTISMGTGNDSIVMKASHLANDTIDAGDGFDTITLSGASTLADSAFTNISSVEKFILGVGNNQSITFGTNAIASGIEVIDGSGVGAGNSVNLDFSASSGGIFNVTLSSGDDSVILGEDAYILNLGNGDNSVSTQSAFLTNGDTIVGGSGEDTLTLTTASELTDSDFTNISNFEKLVLADGANSLEVGAEAKGAGLIYIDGSASSSALTAVVDDSGFEILGGSGADSVEISDAKLSSLTFKGGAGDDTVELSSAATLTGSDFANLTSVEIIKLQDFDNQTIDLSASESLNAMNAGLKEIDAGSLTGSNSITVDISGMTRDISVTTAGGDDEITLGEGDDTISTGEGSDSIRVSSENFTSGDTIDGGGATGSLGILDALNVTTTTNAITDALFENVSDIEVLSLTNTSGTYSVTLGSNANTTGIEEIFIDDGVSATIDLTALAAASTNPIKITKIGTTGDVVVKTLDQDDTIVLGDGADRVEILSANLDGNDNFSFGGGNDTLAVTDAATIVDADFTKITGLETLELADTANSVTLGDIAQDAGVSTIDLTSVTTSTNAQTINISSMTTDQAITIDGGAGAETITMKAEHLTSADTIDGATNTGDTLAFSTIAVAKGDGDFANVTGVETLQLATSASNQSLTLGTEAFDGGNGIKTLDASGVTGTLDLDLTAASDISVSINTGGILNVTMDDDYLTSADHLTGGSDEDTLTIDTLADLNAADFTNVSGIEVLELGATGGTQSVTLAGDFTTVDASAATTSGDDITIDAGTVNLSSVTTGVGADTLKITTANFEVADTIDLGAGTDTLELTTTASNTLNDSFFANKTSIETLKLGDFTAQSIALGNNSVNAGITTIDASTVSTGTTTTIDLSGITAEGIAHTITGGASADTIKMDADQLTAADTIDGGNGEDILEFSSIADGVADAVFENVSNIETLKLSSDDGQSITVGDYAIGNGIDTIDASASANASVTVDTTLDANVTVTGGVGNDIISMQADHLKATDVITGAGGTDTLTLTSTGANISISANAFTGVSGVETLKLTENGACTQNVIIGSGDIATVNASVATDDVTIDGAATAGVNLNSVSTGSGDDTLKIEAGDFVVSDVINLGAGTTDTLELTTDAGSSIDDTYFANKSGIEIFKLANATDQSIALGDTAVGAGITTVNASAGVNTTIDLSGMTLLKDMTLVGGDGDDTFKFKTSHLNASDVITGGEGTDTLVLSTQALSVQDSIFTNVSGVETLELADFDNQNITLSDNALDGDGIRTIDASNLTGTNSVSLDLSSATNNYAMSIETGDGDNTITMKAEHLTGADSFTTGSGDDTLVLTTAATKTGADFAGISGIETLELQASLGDQNIVLSGDFTTVDASVATGDVAINAAINSIDIATITTGSGDDTLTLQASGFEAGDSIDLGSGNNNVVLTTAATLTDALFTNKADLDTLTFGNFASQSVTLGDNAVAAGVEKVDFQAISNTTYAVNVSLENISNDATTNVLLGAGADTITMVGSHLTSSDTLTGGSGSDELILTGAVNLEDAAFTNVSGIETLTLDNDANQTIALGDNGLATFSTIDASAVTTDTNSVSIDISGATQAFNTDITLGAGDDTITLKNDDLTSGDTFDGGTGDEDTLKFTDAVDLTTSVFSNVSNIEKVELQATSGTQSLQLASGINIVDASVATDSVDIDASLYADDLDITTGSGDDTITVNIANLNGSDSIDAGEGTADNLEIKNAGDTDSGNNITDAKLAGLTGVENIVLLSNGDAIDVALSAQYSIIDASATASVNTIDLTGMTTDITILGGSGSDVITLGTGDNTLSLGAGDDQVTIAANTLDANDIIDGGTGNNDQLIITGVVADTTVLDNITGFESIILSGDTNKELILNNASDTNNLLKVDASGVTTSTNTVTIDISAYDISGDVDNFVYVGSAGIDTFTMQSGHLNKDDILDGGAGISDVLELTTTALNSSSITIFNNVSKFEILELANVDLDQSFIVKDGVFTTIRVGDDHVSSHAITIDAGNVTGDITINTIGDNDGSGDDNASVETIIAAKGDNTINAGAGNDIIKFNITTFDENDTINGGTGDDTLEFIDEKTVVLDDYFANTTSIENIVLSQNESAQSIELGDDATSAGIKHVDTQAVSLSVTVDAAALANNLTVNTGSGDDIITAGTLNNTISSNDGNDTIKIAASTLTSDDIIDGGANTTVGDTLELTGVASVDDSAFTQISNIERLKLADATAQSVTLGSLASADADFTTIDTSALSTGNTVSLDLSDFDVDTTVIGGAGEETLTIDSTTLDGSDNIDLGAGSDELVFSNALTSAVNLSGVSGVDTITLADGVSNQTLTLIDTINSSLAIDATTNLTDNHSVTIDGSALGTNTTAFSVTTKGGDDTIILGGSVNTVVSGEGDDLIQISGENLSDANLDTIDGNGGTNTLEITSGGTITDANLSGLSNIDEITLSAEEEYTITLDATNAGTNDIVNITSTLATTNDSSYNKMITIDASTLGAEDVDFDIIRVWSVGGLNGGSLATSKVIIDGSTLNSDDRISTYYLDITGENTSIVDTAFDSVYWKKLTYTEDSSHSLTIGDNFDYSGSSTWYHKVDASVISSENSFTLDMSEIDGTTSKSWDIIGGAGDDTVTMNVSEFTDRKTLDLGSGTDTVQLVGSAVDANAITNANFVDDSSIDGFEIIKFMDNVAQDITIADGIIYLESNLQKIDAELLTSAGASIDVSGFSHNIEIVSGGGDDTIILGGANVTVDSNAGDDIIQIAGTELTKDDVIDGGLNNDGDTLEIVTSEDDLSDIDFTNVSNIETLKLSVDANQTLTLGDKFAAAGFENINASVLTSASSVTVDLSSMSANGDYNITGGAGDDVVKMLGAHITANDKIDLGDGDDIMRISSINTNTTQISDNAFTNISGVETLQFTNYSNSVEFGDLMKVAGVTTIDGSANTAIGYGLDIDLTSMSTANTVDIGGYTLKGGAGDDQFILRADQLTSSDTIDGGGNGSSTGDILEFTTAVDFSNTTNFTNVSNIDTIILADKYGQNLVLEDGLASFINASALSSSNGVTIDGSSLTSASPIKITAGAGDDIISLGAGNDNVLFGAGDDILSIATANLDENDTLDFGLGEDTLDLGGAANLSDSDFTNIDNLEAITLSDASNSIVLGDIAKVSGVRTIGNSDSGAATSTTIDMSSMSSNIGMTYSGGAGEDIIKIVGTHFDSDDTITAGTGDDTLYLTDVSYVTDAAFTNTTGIETLKLANGTHNITLGALAEAAGITAIDITEVTNAITIDISGMTGNIDIASSAEADVIVIGQGTNTITTDGGDDTIKGRAEDLDGTDSIDGGDGTADSFILTSAINETTSDKLSVITNIETLVLGNYNNQSLVLDATNGFTKIDGSYLSGTNSASIDASALLTNLEVVTQGGNDTIVAGDTAALEYTITSGNGDDLIQVSDASAITSANDLIDGGLGNDTLEFTSSSTPSTIDNDFFGTHIKGIETIKFGDVDGSGFTLGAKTIASGVRTLDSTALTGTNALDINLSLATVDMTVNGGAGVENVTAGTKNDTIKLDGGDDSITFAKSTLLTSSDVIDGGAGEDTLTISYTTTVNDSVFTNISNTEKLVLLGTSTKTITLSEYAEQSGINEIDASTKDGTVLSTAKVTINGLDFSGDITLKTGDYADDITIGSGDVVIESNGGNDLIKVEGSDFDTLDSIDAGDGTDTIHFLDAVQLTDDMLGQISNAEIIEFSDKSNQSVLIGDDAASNLLFKYDASDIGSANSIVISTLDMTSNEDMNILGGKGNDTFKFVYDQFTVGDILNGNTGEDTLVLTNTITESSAGDFDALFENKSGIEVIELTNSGDHNFTLGALAKSAGIKEIDASNLTDISTLTIDALNFGSSLKVVSTGENDYIIAGSGNDSYSLGDGDDIVEFKSRYLRSDVLEGGNGLDTIVISDLAKLIDSSLNNMTGFEKIELSDTAGTTSIVLGENAQRSGLVEIDGTALVDEAKIDLSLLDIDFTLTTGSGDDIITLGGANASLDSGMGKDTIEISASNLTAADHIAGGGDNDNLEFTTASSSAVAINDSDFTNVTSIETLVLGNFDDQKITLGTYAKNAGITTIDATALTGSNKIEVDATALNTTAVFTIKTGDGADIIKLGTASDNIDSDSGDDTIIYRNADFSSADVIDGGSGTDTIEIIDAATIADADFTNIIDIEVLKIGDFANQTIELSTNASLSEIEVIDASALSGTNFLDIDLGSLTSAISVIGGDYNDQFTITSEKLSADLSIDGTAEKDNVIASDNDNVIIVDRANISDKSFENFRNIETITLSDFSDQNLELGAYASNIGLETIDASALSGTNSITVDMQNLVANIDFTSGAGSDTVIISTTNTTNADSIDLGDGDGVDALIIGDSIQGIDFDAWLGGNASGLAGIETLKLSNYANQVLELGSAANTLGLTNIDLSDVKYAVEIDASSLGNGVTISSDLGDHVITTATGTYNDTITTGDGDNIITLDAGNDTILTGAAEDTINILASHLDSNDTINGGDDNDILVVTNSATPTAIVDSQFTNITKIETLKLASDIAAQSVTLAQNAENAGIELIDAKSISGGYTLDLSGFSENIEVLNGGGADSVVGGQGDDIIAMAGGDDTITYSSLYLNAYDEIDGGTGIDTLVISDQAIITDTMFTNIEDVEVLKLGANVADQTITLGAKAYAAGITTLDLTGIDGDYYEVDTSLFKGALTILVDTQNGSFTTSSKDDVIEIGANVLTDHFTYNAGQGTDSIKITTIATGDDIVVDADFTNMFSVELVDLSAGGNVTLASEAVDAGITTVDLSNNTTAASTVDASGFKKSLSVILSGQDDTVSTHITSMINDFVYTTSANLTSADIINLGAGTNDAIVITDAANLDATTLGTNITNVEILKLGDTGSHVVSLEGADASITTIDGTLMQKGQTSEVNITGKTETIEVKMGAGNDTILMSLADFTKYGSGGSTTPEEVAAQQVIDGGSGIDSIVITDVANVTDVFFDDPNFGLLGNEKFVGIEGIGLLSGGTITLGMHASAEGITTINVSNSTAASTIDTTAVNKDMTINLGANDGSVTTGSRSDTVNVAAENLNASDTIALGSGIDTINLTTAVNYSDINAFGGVLNVERLSLSANEANQSLVLTDTYFSEFDASTITTGSVSVDVTGMTEQIKVTLGQGDDTVIMETADLTVSDMEVINGNKGEDTLEIVDTSASTLTDDDFVSRQITGFEAIKLNGSLTAGSNFYATGIDKVIASGALTFDGTLLSKSIEYVGSSAVDTVDLAGKNDIIYRAEGSDVIHAGGGNDIFYLDGSDLDAADVLDGEVGTDSIRFTNAANIVDTVLAGVSVEEIYFVEDGNTQSFEFGTNAAANGIAKLYASDLTSDFTLDKSSEGTITFVSGSGDDTFKVTTTSFSATDKIDLGEGTNTLEFTDAGDITDAGFASLKNFDKLVLADGANTIALGTKFLASGITTIDASASSGTTEIDMSLIGTKKAYVINGGAEVDTIKLKSSIADSGITIGGGDSDDILVIVNAAKITDATFANFTSLEVLQLSDIKGNLVTLGANATTAGITTIDGSSMTGSGTMVVDSSDMTSNKDLTITGGVNSDQLTVQTDHLTTADTLDGGDGEDTLVVTGNGDQLTDTDFANTSGFEVLSFESGFDYSVVLGTNASSGFTTIDGSNLKSGDNLTVDASASDFDTIDLDIESGNGTDVISTAGGDDHIITAYGNDTITSGAGDDYIDGGNGDDKFIFADADLTSTDYIQGGSGDDTLEITDTAMLDSSATALDRVFGVETLMVSGGGEATVNYHMQQAGIRTIDGTGSSTSLLLDATYTAYNMELIGGSAADTIFAGQGTDTLTGNGGEDIFVFNSAEKVNGTNTITDFTSGTDLIGLSFISGTTDYVGNVRADGTGDLESGDELSASDFNNYIQNITYDKYDTNDDGTLDGDFALITLAGGDTISLLGVSSGISEADFVYQLV